MHDVYYFLSRVRGNPPYLTFPLNYPDPEGEFYGYDCRQVRAANGTLAPSTKELINCVGKAALAIVTLKAKAHVKNKNDCLPQYQVHVNDVWTAFLQDVYAKCRHAWNYLERPRYSPNQRASRLDPKSSFSPARATEGSTKLLVGDAPGRKATSTRPTRPPPNSM